MRRFRRSERWKDSKKMSQAKEREERGEYELGRLLLLRLDELAIRR